MGLRSGSIGISIECVIGYIVDLRFRVFVCKLVRVLLGLVGLRVIGFISLGSGFGRRF